MTSYRLPAPLVNSVNRHADNGWTVLVSERGALTIISGEREAYSAPAPAPVSADALYEAATLAVEGFRGDAAHRLSRGVPNPADMRHLADTADLVYDLAHAYISHPDYLSGAHRRVVGL